MELNKNTNKNNPLRVVSNANKSKQRASVENRNHKNLVFTSAGDKTKFDSLWLGDNQNFDIMVV